MEHDGCGVGFVVRRDGVASREVVELALRAVVNLTHRGALDADATTGDGAGLLLPIPHGFFRRELAARNTPLRPWERLAVGQVFLPTSEARAATARRVIEQRVAARGLRIVAWRDVPVAPEVLGEKARATCPRLEQLFILPHPLLDALQYERRLLLVRREVEKKLEAMGLHECSIPSFSHRTIVYKGLLVGDQLGRYFLDLQDPDFVAPLVVFHQRYSTNTLPTWHLAQPFRFLAHNGEINTLQGNVNAMHAREPAMESKVWGKEIATLSPVVVPNGSDSAALDNVLELLTLSGRDVVHGLRMLIPEAWERMTDMPATWRDFYEYHAALMEPWDGPAALAFTDGTTVGAALDRNGLRPLRYKVTYGGLVVAGSEAGVVDLDDGRVAEKGRLGPGEILTVETATGTIRRHADLMDELSRCRPYGDWLHDHLVRAPAPRDGIDPLDTLEGNELLHRQRICGMSHEDLRMVIGPMAGDGADPVWSMGDDTPLPPLATIPPPLWTYFKQRFAQVTNPAIDSLRETLVMSLDGYIGPRGSLLTEEPDHAHLVHLPSPLLSGGQLQALRDVDDPAFASRELPVSFPAEGGADALRKALDRLCMTATRATCEGAAILILTDRDAEPDRVPIPMLLAVAAVHHHLIRVGCRAQAVLVAETGAAWDIHHVALLLGYGAVAVHPYIALATVRAVARDSDGALAAERALANYRTAVEKGLLKILAKMGIATLRSYRGAQIFEAIGLDPEVIERYFTGTPSPLGGIGLAEIAEDARAWHRAAFDETTESALIDRGVVRFRRRGEHHAFRPDGVKMLHKAVRDDDRAAYRDFAVAVNDGHRRALRHLVEPRSGLPTVPLAEVEPVETIHHRFVTGAMSLGALSPAAHQVLSTAMNRMGARSNTGEGGEDRRWYFPPARAEPTDGRIKQVASGRFGVTPEYLSRAEEIEIKIAQGSKPGEGGQIPGTKVTEFIARVRLAVPGIPLISPPPHHDIYSIEDLAQLIHDLKEVNPRARVGVKLVAESGVGTIAAGVAKAYADYIQISGAEGGTGASSLSSIKHAGCPWELGLAETQQVLMRGGLRGRVRLRVDGGFQTGRDVVVAALLGADEYGFGTAALVAMGCRMARHCHLNNCPTGIATQREDLIRKTFRGEVEHVVRYFTFVAEEVRELLAALGLRSMADAVGRADLLAPSRLGPSDRASHLRVERLLQRPEGDRRGPARRRNRRPIYSLDRQRIVRDAAPALDYGLPVHLRYPVRTRHLAIGAGLAGEIARRFDLPGLPEGLVEIRLEGSAGQSLGAFCMPGMRLVLEGEANDYVAKGMAGGEIAVLPSPRARFAAHDNVIVGNVVLYG
ncbi:MAG: glutamate synthase large subunit, partial [Nitrospirota bacterium]